MNHFITQHTITFLVARMIAAPRPTGSVDHLLIFADALDELATEQYASGQTIASPSTRIEAAKLRDVATALSEAIKSERRSPESDIPHGTEAETH
jgi:hypothetical protein